MRFSDFYWKIRRHQPIGIRWNDDEQGSATLWRAETQSLQRGNIEWTTTRCNTNFFFFENLPLESTHFAILALSPETLKPIADYILSITPSTEANKPPAEPFHVAFIRIEKLADVKQLSQQSYDQNTLLWAQSC